MNDTDALTETEREALRQARVAADLCLGDASAQVSHIYEAVERIVAARVAAARADRDVVDMLADLLPGWDGTPGHLRQILGLFGIRAAVAVPEPEEGHG